MPCHSPNYPPSPSRTPFRPPRPPPSACAQHRVAQRVHGGGARGSGSDDGAAPPVSAHGTGGRDAGGGERDLSGNQLAGSIPSLLSLTNLMALKLANNSLEGHLPQSLNALRKLEMIDLGGNRLSGRVAENVATLKRLLHVDLSNNSLGGTFPRALSVNRRLTFLNLASNRFHGRLPWPISKNMITLLLASNRFEGNVPWQWGQLQDLETLDVSSNNISGTIPLSLAHCTRLHTLLLQSNNLSGEVPVGLAALPLQQLSVADNALRGHINASFHHLPLASFEGNPELCVDLSGMGRCSAVLQGHGAPPHIEQRRACAHGQVELCACADGAQGQRACVDGKGFTACMCPSGEMRAWGKGRERGRGGRKEGEGEGEGGEEGGGGGEGRRRREWEQGEEQVGQGRKSCAPLEGATSFPAPTSAAAVAAAVVLVLALVAALVVAAVFALRGGLRHTRPGAWQYAGRTTKLKHPTLLPLLPLLPLPLLLPPPIYLLFPPRGQFYDPDDLEGYSVVPPFSALPSSLPSSLASISFFSSLKPSRTTTTTTSTTTTGKSSSFKAAAAAAAAKKGRAAAGAGATGGSADGADGGSGEGAGGVGSSALATAAAIARRLGGPTGELEGIEAADLSCCPLPPPPATHLTMRQFTLEELSQATKSAAHLTMRQFSLDDLSRATNAFHSDSLLTTHGTCRSFTGHLPPSLLSSSASASSSSATSPDPATAAQGEGSEGAGIVIKEVEGSEGETAGAFAAAVEVFAFVRCPHLVEASMSPLPWPMRMAICLDVAKGLAYLHAMTPQMTHAALTTASVALDDAMRAKLADYCLPLLLSHPRTPAATAGAASANRGAAASAHSASVNMAVAAGTAAPELAWVAEATPRVDVYAFGVLLLEVISGRRPLDATRPPNEQSLVHWAKARLTQRSLVERMVDPLIARAISTPALYQVAVLASQCIHSDPDTRPTMLQAVEVLSRVQSLPLDAGTPHSKHHLPTVFKRTSEDRTHKP
ncbi:unnamed protein product [Closterium sp. Naga37s-1]|nr:unnamed protein product [Closterium sp. Naga37s-1]